jgi:hypothetical protein
MWAVVQSYKHMHACLLVAMPNPPLQSPATTTRSRGRLCELHSTRDMLPHIGGGTGALVQCCKDQLERGAAALVYEARLTPTPHYATFKWHLLGRVACMAPNATITSHIQHTPLGVGTPVMPRLSDSYPVVLQPQPLMVLARLTLLRHAQQYVAGRMPTVHTALHAKQTSCLATLAAHD